MVALCQTAALRRERIKSAHSAAQTLLDASRRDVMLWRGAIGSESSSCHAAAEHVTRMARDSLVAEPTLFQHRSAIVLHLIRKLICYKVECVVLLLIIAAARCTYMSCTVYITTSPASIVLSITEGRPQILSGPRNQYASPPWPSPSDRSRSDEHLLRRTLPHYLSALYPHG